MNDLRCQECFITYDELIADKEHGEALWMCMSHHCFNCTPKDLNDKLLKAGEKFLNRPPEQ